MLVQGSVSVAAASVNNNILDGSLLERMPFNGKVSFGLVGDTNATDLVVDVYSGQDVIAENMTPSAQDRTPLNPDDFTLMDVAAYNEQLKVRVRNTHASLARTLYYSVIAEPIV